MAGNNIKDFEYLRENTIFLAATNGFRAMTVQTTLTSDALSVFTAKDSDAPERAARFLKSLAHRDRLKVLCGLVDGELPVALIEAKVGASQSAVSQHLARLRDEGIVTARRDGRQIYYSISDPMVLSMMTLLYQRFCGNPSGT